MHHNNALINPAREANEPRIEYPVLMLPNPAEMQAVNQLFKKRITERYSLFNFRLVKISPEGDRGEFFVAGPAVGAPMAVLALEKLIALGASRVLVAGWCGGIGEQTNIGDLVLPTRAISGEGTSPYYPLMEKPLPNQALLSALKYHLTQHASGKLHQGPVVSIDAPYRETTEFIDVCLAGGVIAIDMELSALLTVAAFRAIELAAVFVVSDTLYNGEWVKGFSAKTFRLARNNLLRCIDDFWGNE